MLIIGPVLLLLLDPCVVHVGGRSCQDIDHNSCLSYARQNANMCSDPVLSNTACPAFCSNCPVTCYNCNTTNPDVSKCNTVACQNGEMCMRVTANIGGKANAYKMSCGPTSICSGLGKRRVQRDLSIECCSHDLCNAPISTTTTTTIASTTKATRTMSTPTTAQSSTSTSASQSTSTTATTTSTTAPASSSVAPLTISQPNCTRDICFMVDDSLGMQLAAMSTIKDCVAGVIEHLAIGYNDTRVALGTFNTAATTRWELDRYTDKPSLLGAVRNFVPSHYALTAHNLEAVDYVVKGFNTGNRANVPDVLVMVSGGGSHRRPGRFLFSNWHTHVNDGISQLHQKTKNVIAIAVGHADQNEMRRIATDTNHYFHIPDFQAFDKQELISNVANLIC